MDNRNWVDERMAMLEPAAEWHPGSQRAYARLQRPPHRRNWKWIAVTAALVLAVGIVPAQHLWNTLILGRVNVVRLDLDNLDRITGLHSELISKRSDLRVAANAAEAATFAGYLPRLLPDARGINVTGPLVAAFSPRTAELRQALQQTGAHNVEVPESWNNAQLSVNMEPMVIAEYDGDMSLIQIPPLALHAPAGFEMTRFATVVFRILGAGDRESRSLGRKFADNPGWFLGVPRDERVNIQEIALPSGPGILVEDLDENGKLVRRALIWSTPDRIFALSGRMSREEAIRAAGGL